MTYIRSMDEALAELAGILDLPARRDQLVRSTVGIVSCLEPGPRAFMADCQALLIEGGLEALRQRRESLLEPLVVLDPEEDRYFASVAAAVDALRLAEVFPKVFPDLRGGRWLAARALLAQEGDLQRLLVEAIRAGRGTAEFEAAWQEAAEILFFHRPAWHDRLGTLRVACLGFLKDEGQTEADRLHEEAETLFELAAVSDERAEELLAAVEASPVQAAAKVRRLFDAWRAVQEIQKGETPSSVERRQDVA